jgi:nitrogen regulatory protein P-II 1
MIKVEAYIRPASLPLFHEALVAAGVGGITVWQTKGVGQHFHKSERPKVFRGAEMKEIYIDRIRVETVIEDEARDAVVGAMTALAKESDVGTLRVFLSPVSEEIRIPEG